MTDLDKQTYMELLAAKLMNGCAIEDSRKLTGLEKIMSQCAAQEYDAKIAIGWPDTMSETLGITSI